VTYGSSSGTSSWTGTALGAGTAWQYDLNGDSVNDNADGSDTQTHHQVVGIYSP
jgi:hypothetical protein